MKMDRGLLSILFVIVLMAHLVGCASTGAGSSQSSPGGDVLTFPLIVSGGPPENLDRMETAFNAYVKDRIDATVHFVTVEMDTLEDFYLLQKSSSEVTDFVCLMPAEALLSNMVEAGLVRPLDDLLSAYGQGILQCAEEVLPAGRLGDVQYMIPEVKDVYTMGISLEFSAPLVKKYDFDITQIHSLTDVEPMLEVIHEQEPDVIGLVASLDPGFSGMLGGYDELGNALGVLNLKASQDRKVVDWYETEEFASIMRQVREWYLRGYLDPDAVVNQRSGTQLMLEGKAFCSLGTIMPLGDQGTDVDNSTRIVEIALDDVPQILSSYYAGLEGVCISSSCPYPEKAMQLLELLYTDTKAIDFLEYGVEGVHYTITEDGMTDSGGRYFLLFGQPGNQKIRTSSITTGEDYAEKCKEFKVRDIVSPAFGFVCDTAPIAREIAMCQAVVDEYLPVIDCGCVDPETEIPKFVGALKEAGIDTIVAEKQRQLDEWAKRNR